MSPLAPFHSNNVSLVDFLITLTPSNNHNLPPFKSSNAYLGGTLFIEICRSPLEEEKKLAGNFPLEQED